MALTPVQKELSRIAADHRRYFLFRWLSFGWGAIVLAGLGLYLLHQFLRITIPFAAPGLAIAAVVLAVLLYSRARRIQFGLRDIAREVEKEDPKLNTLLLAAVEQEPELETGRLHFLQLRVIREALAANRRSPWHQRFTERLFYTQCAHLVMLMLVIATLFGLGFTVPQTPTAIARRSEVKITPGTAEVERGSTVAIIAEFPVAPRGEVRLVYKTRSQGERTAGMTRSLKDPLFGATLSDVQEDTDYQVIYDDGRSRDFQLTVFEYPVLKRADAQLDFPEYTRFPAKKIEDTRRISAVEGTTVNYEFYLNKPVRSARLAGKGENSGEIVLTNKTGKPSLYAADFVLKASENYRIELIDEEGRTNRIPTEFVFVALPNETPKLKLQSPRGDQRVSALQEVKFEAQAEDDFGLASYGIAYTTAGGKTEKVELSTPPLTNAPAGMLSQPHEARAFNWLLALERLGAEPQELISYYLWAEDMGPDGKIRQTASDIYFAEIRPFEEIFRENNSDSSSQQSQGQNANETTRLIELQKQIIQATWNLQRKETGAKPSKGYAADAKVVKESQESALKEAKTLAGRIQDEKSKAIAKTGSSAMESAITELALAADKNTVDPLSSAVEFEQTAYQALLKLQAREYQVNRSRSRSGGQGGNQQAQRQLDQLELKEEENRYETESQASPL